ncbi:MAG: DUF1223 domain-containing protein [Caulobacteraceae bacterium]
MTICAAWALACPVLARAPVVVELFTAQGCSSCVKANAYLARLADRQGVIALTWSVDYWDYLGWKDTFAQPEFADRQRAYDKHFGLRDVYTPQVIVDGAAQASGDKAAAVEGLIREARRAPLKRPAMALREDGRIAVGSGARPRGGGEVWLIRFDPREQDVVVKEGDNRGATIPHRNVVRQLVRLGSWSGRPVTFKLPTASEEGLTTLVLVQPNHGGRVLGTLESDATKGVD